MSTDKKQNTPIVSQLLPAEPGYADLIVKLLDGLPHRFHEIRLAQQAGDFQLLKQHAHRLAGIASHYGYPLLREIAMRLEIASSEKAVNKTISVVEELRDVCDRMLAGRTAAAALVDPSHDSD